MLGVCWCLRLVPQAEAGKTTLKTRPKETGRLNRHCLPPPLSGRFQFWVTPQPIRFPSCFSTPSRRIRKETMGFWETRHTSNLEVPREPRLLPPPLPRPGHHVWLRTGTAGGGAPAPPRARDLRSHALPRLAGAPLPTDTPFLRTQPPATLC